jgi:hypothetical protein
MDLSAQRHVVEGWSLSKTADPAVGEVAAWVKAEPWPARPFRS